MANPSQFNKKYHYNWIFDMLCLVDTGKREYIGLSCGYKMNLRSVSGGQKSASHFLMGHRSIGIAVLAIR